MTTDELGNHSMSRLEGGPTWTAFLLLLAAAGVPADDPSPDDDAPAVLADTTRSPSAAELGDFDVPRDGGGTPTPPPPPVPAKAVPAPAVKVRRDRRRARSAAPAVVEIPAGCFLMGSPDGEGAANERPRHQACLDSFRLDRFPVSQREYEDSVGTAPWNLCAGRACADPDPKSPAWFVTWTEAADFCRRKGGRLPTEAEYEYALRAGDTATYAWGDSLEAACRFANLADLSLARALPGWKVFPCDDHDPLVGRIGTRSPNRWGLHDMTGNVWEWTADWYAPDAYERSAGRNPRGPESGTGRVIRGGSWMTGPDGARAAYRDGFNPEGRYTGSIGFRCAYPAR